MLERTRNNPNAIIYGTYHSYPVMQHLLSCCSNMMSGYATHKELGHTRPLVSKQSASNIESVRTFTAPPGSNWLRASVW
jgi:hypothetical protein